VYYAPIANKKKMTDSFKNTLQIFGTNYYY